MTIKNDILWRIYMSFFAIALIGGAVMFQAFRIQLVEGKEWTDLADSLTTEYRTIPSERGNIFSSDGRLLATSLPFFQIRFDAVTPALTDDIFYQKVDSLALCMERKFQEHDRSYYKQKLINARKQGNRYLQIQRKVTYPELQEIQQWPIFRLGQYKGGLIVEQSNKREIPFGMLAHRTIGYVRTGPGSQSVGLEERFNEYLDGRDGKRLMQRISGGAWIPINDENEIEPQNGRDLRTTIDLNIQDVAENALLKTLKANNAKHGSVILMEVATGKIRAIANLGRMPDDSYWEHYNYAIGEATEPGSTFKLATMMSLLEDDMIELDDSINIGYGEVRYYGQAMRDAEAHGHGKVSIAHAFEISSNVGISLLANSNYKDDPKRFVEHLRDFHLDQPVGIEINGEANPLIKSPGDHGWSRISVPWMSVGYEIQLTPLQILTFYNAVANNGRMMKPYLAEAIMEYGREVKRFSPVVIDDHICSDATVQKLQGLLEGVVERGTARGIRTDEYKIAGKTGTAQIAQGDQGYAKVYQASFVGYFPADNPQYSCIVTVNAPSNGVYYGGSVAAPVFREIADNIYAHKLQMQKPDTIQTNDHLPSNHVAGFQADFHDIYSDLAIPGDQADGEPWIQVQKDNDSLHLRPLPLNKNLVPNVSGMGLRDALFLLENRGIKVDIEGYGKVFRQSVRPGTAIRKGMTIKLELS